jgi:hypothetical protein
MYFPTDIIYLETKSIKLSEKDANQEFQELSIWAKNELNITILNGVFTLKNSETLPSLHIILESQIDYIALHGDTDHVYNQKYNALIASEFIKIMRASNIDGFENFKGGDFHMSYSIFSKMAIIECLNEISKSDIDSIKKLYSSIGLWEISIKHGSVIIFYTTEKIKESIIESGIHQEIKNNIIVLANQYDTFNYLEKSSIFFRTDSKENFNERYNGSWHSYYR